MSKKIIFARMEEDRIEALKKVAGQDGHTLSSLIRKVLNDFLNKKKKEK